MKTQRYFPGAVLKNVGKMALTAQIKTPTVTYEQPLGLYIDGKWEEGIKHKTFETINPTDESVIVAVCEAGPEGESHNTS